MIMRETTRLSWDDTFRLTDKLADRVLMLREASGVEGCPKIWGIPKGGQHVAGLVAARWEDYIEIVDDPTVADVAVDDIIDSGRTARKIWKEYGLKTFALVENTKSWVEFAWETGGLKADAQNTVVRMLQQIGEDPQRDGLVDTPSRVVDSWNELYVGYEIADPTELLKTFVLPELQSDGEGAQNIIQVNDIAFMSMCEHHMMPFYGTVDVAYAPDTDRGVIGLSKISRVVDAYARRLQIQERLTAQVADAIKTVSAGVKVKVTAQHMCLVSRGTKQRGAAMITHVQRGTLPMDADDWTKAT